MVVKLVRNWITFFIIVVLPLLGVTASALAVVVFPLRGSAPAAAAAVTSSRLRIVGALLLSPVSPVPGAGPRPVTV